MKRILLMVFKNILLVPVMWCELCYYAGHVEKYTEQQIYKMLTFIVLRANKGGRVTIDVHGKENIPEKDGFMFFPNHQGMFTSIFSCSKKRGRKCTVFETGFQMHESIYNGPE